MAQLMKLAQATYAAHALGTDASSGLETAAALAELISLRMDQLKTVGRIVPSEAAVEPPSYEWLEWNAPFGEWEDVAVRAVSSSYKYMTGAVRIEATGSVDETMFTPIGPRVRLTPSVREGLVELVLWANCELMGLEEETSTMRVRCRPNRN